MISKRWLTGWMCVWMFSLAAAGLTQPTVTSPIEKKIGNLSFKFTAKVGAQLTVAGVPVIKDSSFWVIKPGWTHIYGTIHDTTFFDKITIQESADEIQIKVKYDYAFGTTSPVQGTEIFTLRKDNSYSDELEFSYSDESTPALFEWCPGNLYAMMYIGRPYTKVDFQGSVQEGYIPFRPVGDGISSSGEADIAKGFKSFRMNSLIGPVEITQDIPDDQFRVMDYRNNRWSMNAAPFFWVGRLETPIVPHQVYKYKITMKFPEKPIERAQTVPVVQSVAPVISGTEVQSPHQDPMNIVPAPKSLQFTRSEFEINAHTVLFLGKNPTPGILSAADFLLRELRDKYNLRINVVREDLKEYASVENAILMGDAPRHPQFAKLLNRTRLPIPDQPEGYSLLISPKNIILSSKTEQGVYYGVASLVQLIKVSKQGVSFKCAKVRDYPTLDFRGIHMYTAKNGGDEHSRAVRDLIARFKSNYLMYTVDYMSLDRHPELRHPVSAMDKKEVEKVVQTARRNFVEPFPCMSALGHSRWMFFNHQNLDIAEDTIQLETYCPDSARAYELLFDAYDEVIDLFKPKYFNFVESELMLPGGAGPGFYRHKDKNMLDLVLDDTRKLDAYFKTKKVTPMIWGDMYLWYGESPDACNAESPEEAVRARKELPKDIVMADWHYAPAVPEDYKSLKLFKDAGYKIIGATWYMPNDIRNLTLSVISNKGLGTLQTTWAGVDMQISAHPQEWYQYWTYPLAAHYSWSGDTTAPEDLSFNHAQLFIDTWQQRKPLLRPRNGFTVDLRNYNNCRLADDTVQSGWLGYGSKYDLSRFPLGFNQFGETWFRVLTNANRHSAVMLAGKMNPPGNYPESLTVNVKPIFAAELHFLMTAAYLENDKTHIGAIKIKYLDNTESNLNLIYNENLWTGDDQRAWTNGRIAWKTKTPSGQQISLRDVVWKNPNPTKKIKTITVSSNNTIAAPILLGITGVN